MRRRYGSARQVVTAIRPDALDEKVSFRIVPEAPCVTSDASDTVVGVLQPYRADHLSANQKFFLALSCECFSSRPAAGLTREATINDVAGFVCVAR